MLVPINWFSYTWGVKNRLFPNFRASPHMPPFGIGIPYRLPTIALSVPASIRHAAAPIRASPQLSVLAVVAAAAICTAGPPNHSLAPMHTGSANWGGTRGGRGCRGGTLHAVPVQRVCWISPPAGVLDCRSSVSLCWGGWSVGLEDSRVTIYYNVGTWYNSTRETTSLGQRYRPDNYVLKSIKVARVWVHHFTMDSGQLILITLALDNKYLLFCV